MKDTAPARARRWVMVGRGGPAGDRNDLDDTLIVEAAAGTGKTTELVTESCACSRPAARR